MTAPPISIVWRWVGSHERPSLLPIRRSYVLICFIVSRGVLRIPGKGKQDTPLPSVIVGAADSTRHRGDLDQQSQTSLPGVAILISSETTMVGTTNFPSSHQHCPYARLSMGHWIGESARLPPAWRWGLLKTVT